MAKKIANTKNPFPFKNLFSTRLCLTILLFALSFAARAQTITLELREATLETAFTEIKKQSGYSFWYEKNQLQGLRPVSVRITNETLKTALGLVLKDQPLSYEIVDRTIVISKKKAVTEPKNEETKIFLLKGKVSGPDGQPLAGATVKDELTGRISHTDGNGSFSLPTNRQNGKISISFIGLVTEKVDYQVGNNMDIKLSQEDNVLRSVEINAGYYKTTQRQLTGSISSIGAKEIEKQPVANPISALQGRTTGAQITQSTGTPGANISVVIRGQNGIETSTNPLYLIDGIPYGGTSLTNSLSVNGAVYGNAGSSPLSAISPSDIASIEILKDADATAIYGSRGANGVVLITTKKGQMGAVRINLDHSSGSSTLTRMLSMLGTQDYLNLRKQALALDGTTIKATDYDLNGTWDQSRNVNWQKELLNNPAPFNNSSISVSSGTQTSSFLLSGTRNAQGSSIESDKGYERLGAHLAGGQSTFDQKLQASFSATYSTEKTNWLNQDLYLRALGLQPNAPDLKNPDGSLNWANSTWINPLRALENSYQSKNSTLLASAALSYQPIKDLTAKISLGYTSQNLSDQSTTPVSFYDPAEGRTPATSIADYNTTSQTFWSAEPQLSFRRETKFGSFSILTGMSLQQQKRNSLILRGTGFASDALIGNVKAATTPSVRDNTESRYSYAGIYARAGYALRDRYYLNVTARRDASSRFGPDNRSANFGSIAISWIFSEEKPVREKFSFLSFGKLRASYGTTGSDQLGDYEYLDTYQSGLGYNFGPGLSPQKLSNPDLGWESTRKFEAALEAGVLKDRIRLILAHYRNRSSSPLIDYPLALTTGFSSIRANLDAVIQNTGWELELSADILKANTNRLSWNASFNLTLPKNKLVSFPGLEASSYATRYAIGRPLAINKYYHLLGVDPTSGLYTFEDVNRDGVISALDRQTIIERTQSFYGGLENSLRYRNLELSFLFQFVRQQANNLRSLYNNMPGRSFNQPQSYQGSYWTKPGDIAQMQRPSSGSLTAANTALNNYVSSDAAVSDASFIRLKTVAVSYRPKKFLSGAIKFYLQGQNLLTITGYNGIDPESASLSLPPMRTIVAGLQLSLSVNPKTSTP